MEQGNFQIIVYVASESHIIQTQARSLLAQFYVEIDKPDAAREQYEFMFEHGFPGNSARDGTWLSSLARAGEVCAYLGDASRAADLYDLLAPYRRYNVVIDVGGFCLGPVAHRLGLLAATLRRWDEASDDFTMAIELNERMGAAPWLARTCHDYARMLMARDDRDGDWSAWVQVTRGLQILENVRMQGLHSALTSMSETLRPEVVGRS